MPNATLIEHELSGMVQQLAKTEGLTLKGKLPCSVYLELNDKAYSALDNDPLLLAKMTEAATTEYKKLVAKMVKDLRSANQLYSRLTQEREREKLIDRFEKEAEKSLAAFSREGAAAAQKTWDDMTKAHRDYRDYNIKAKAKLAATTVTIGAAAATTATASAGTGGLSLALTIYPIAKKAAGLVQALIKFNRDADKAGAKLNSLIKDLQKSCSQKTKELDGAKDTGKAFINKLFGFDVMSTIESLEKDNKDYAMKLQKVDIESHKLAIELNSILKRIEKAKQQPDVRASKKIMSSLEKLETKIGDLTTKIFEMQKKVNDGTDAYEANEKILKDLSKAQPNKWKVLQKGLIVVDLAADIGDLSNKGSSALNAAADLYSQINDIKKDMDDRKK